MRAGWGHPRARGRRPAVMARTARAVRHRLRPLAGACRPCVRTTPPASSCPPSPGWCATCPADSSPADVDRRLSTRRAGPSPERCWGAWRRRFAGWPRPRFQQGRASRRRRNQAPPDLMITASRLQMRREGARNPRIRVLKVPVTAGGMVASSGVIIVRVDIKSGVLIGPARRSAAQLAISYRRADSSIRAVTGGGTGGGILQRHNPTSRCSWLCAAAGWCGHKVVYRATDGISSPGGYQLNVGCKLPLPVRVDGIVGILLHVHTDCRSVIGRCESIRRIFSRSPVY